MDGNQGAGENPGIPGNQGAASAAPAPNRPLGSKPRSTGWRKAKAEREAAAAAGANAPAAGSAPQAAKAGEQIDLERLREIAPQESALVEGALDKTVDMDPKSVDAILSLGFYEVMHVIMNRLHREHVTMQEAEKWAEVSRIVWWEYLRRAEASQLIWVLYTGGLVLSKKPIPKEMK